MLRENSRVILGDAIDTALNIKNTFIIKDARTRDSEVSELIARIVDDIRTVIRNEGGE